MLSAITKRLPALPFILILESLFVTLAATMSRELWSYAVAACLVWFCGLTLHQFFQTCRPSRWKQIACLVSLPLTACTTICLLAFSLPSLLRSFPNSPSASTLPTLVPVLCLVLGAFLAFLEVLGTLKSQSDDTTTPVKASQLAIWRLLSILHLGTAAFLLVESYLKTQLHHYIVLFLVILTLVSLLETIWRSISRLYIPRHLWSQSPPIGALFFTKYWGSPYKHAFPKRADREDDFAVQLPDMWMWPTVRRSLLPLCFTTALLCWLSTALHEIPRGHVGIHTRVGKIIDQPLEAGLRFTFPSPFSRVETVSTDQVHTLTLGFKSDSGDAILWEKAHYVEEENSLVGSGDDFLAISVPIHYRINNPVSRSRHIANPDTLLKNLARQALSRETTHLSSFEVMTSRREILRQAVRKRLQNELDNRQAGIEIVEVYLRDIHPPVAAAKAFQDVFSALEDKHTHIHSAEAQINESLPRARTNSYTTVLKEKARGRSRVLAATGKAKSFEALAHVYASNEEIYRIREDYLALDETLTGAKKMIIDSRFANDIPAFIDLRKVLNPAFIDGSAPTPQKLIPDFKGQRSTFDRVLEGYRMRGKGEAPAAHLHPKDEDNLLQGTSGNISFGEKL